MGRIGGGLRQEPIWAGWGKGEGREGEGGGKGGRRKKGARKEEKKERGGKGRGEEERCFPKDIVRRTNVALIGARASEGGREG